jgi:ABC-type Fe3+/spermidine/putrescine transport system ATPase subunit
MELLETLNLTKSFAPGETAVADVSLAVHEGEIVCLLGPSGCGKTTLLRLIAGLETPDAGEVWFDGRNVAPIPPHEREFGMMFQDFALFPHLNVYKNVAFGLEMHRQTPAQIAARLAEMLDLVDLAGFAQRDVAQLSGGEQQRVALARALAPRPRLLMLDEPLGALDRALRERLMLEVRAILQRVGVTAVYVTHDQTEAFAIADRIAVMQAGQIVQIDRPETIYRRPATPFVARFLGFQNVLTGVVVDGALVETAVGRLRLPELPPAGRPVTLLLRPEGARLAAPAEAEGENVLRARVTAVSFRGKFYQVHIAAGAETDTGQRLMFEWTTRPDVQVDEQVWLALAPDALVPFAT